MDDSVAVAAATPSIINGGPGNDALTGGPAVDILNGEAGTTPSTALRATTP